MVKQPRPGRVKTRLAAGIGKIEATWWYRHQCRKLFRDVASPKWQVVLAVSPDAAINSTSDFSAIIPAIPQGRGDLGDRMARIFQRFAPDPTIIIGSDIPNVSTNIISRAFDDLGAHDGVIGPASDGGYWLIGLRGTPGRRPDLFKGVRWSAETTMTDTLTTLAGLRICRTTTLDDVDCADDLIR